MLRQVQLVPLEAETLLELELESQSQEVLVVLLVLALALEELQNTHNETRDISEHVTCITPLACSVQERRLMAATTTYAQITSTEQNYRQKHTQMTKQNGLESTCSEKICSTHMTAERENGIFCLLSQTLREWVCLSCPSTFTFYQRHRKALLLTQNPHPCARRHRSPCSYISHASVSHA